MTEIVAAHLERVARDLAQDSRAVYQTAYAKDMSKSVMERHEAEPGFAFNPGKAGELARPEGNSRA